MSLQSELNLRDLISLVIRRWWIIAATVVVALVAALAWNASRTPLYQSSASILVNQTSASDIFDPLSGASPYTYVERLAENEARFLGSDVVAAAVEERYGFQTAVRVTTDDYADVLTVTANSDDPARAQQIAQAFADTYVEVRRDDFRAQRATTKAKLTEQLAEVNLQLLEANDEDRARLLVLGRDLADSLDLLTITIDLAESSGAQVIDNAGLAKSPFSPRSTRNLALGAFLGLLVGASGALAVEALDGAVRSRAMLESLTPGAPNLAVVPSFARSPGRPELLVAAREPTGSAAEAFRTLRAALQYVTVDKPVKVIQIVSAHSATGKTTVSANLAVTLAQAGQRVAVVDCDLRRPRLHQVFDAPQVPGLTSALIGAAPLKSCMYRVAVGADAAPVVVPSGPIPPGPSELLGSAAAERVIARVAAAFDTVILDTPPVLAVADALVLAQYCDASILVVDAKKTKRNDVALAFERLQHAGSPLIGTVFNNVSRRSEVAGYGYGYSYGYGEDRPRGLASWFSRKSVEPVDVEVLNPAQVRLMTDADTTGSSSNGTGDALPHGSTAADEAGRTKTTDSTHAGQPRR